MLKHNLGYPRIGIHRELKKAIEYYWKGKIASEDLFKIGKKLRKEHWLYQSKLEGIPCNDFSFYDHVLDMSFLLGAIPKRYSPLLSLVPSIDLYFAMARGYQKDGLDIIAMEMTKWFDTNYHYIVPEFNSDQDFKLYSTKVFDEFKEAKEVLRKIPKPVLIGPVSYLLLGKEKEKGFDRIDLIDRLLPIYLEILQRLKEKGANWVQLDEPFLVLDLSEKEKKAFEKVYNRIANEHPTLKIFLATYFGALDENISLALKLPVTALHIDLINSFYQFDELLDRFPKNRMLSLGIINGRNIWRNDYELSLKYLRKASKILGEERLIIAPSCSFLHVPFDLEFEINICPEIKDRMAFAYQKLQEIQDLQCIFKGNRLLLKENQNIHKYTHNSKLIHDSKVKIRLASNKDGLSRENVFEYRYKLQRTRFNFPLFPTTTIGSFPQTSEVRQLRADFKKGTLDRDNYEKKIKDAIIQVINIQEEIGLDLLVHGEFERNDMVEYFGDQLKGFLSTTNAWVQSYGSRCVKPPIIYGDVSRSKPMTVYWTNFAQKQTKKPMKGMLTGPVTILQWSFVRDDQPRSTTAKQIAWAIRDEVLDLEHNGIGIIQIDEPALREGMPLKKKNRKDYFKWAINAFKIASSGVRDDTQIHTHMCYSDFNEILEYIAYMDADVITIETSRSQMKLLEAFSNFQYPNAMGPGIYDIHSPRIPSTQEIKDLLALATRFLPVPNLWVNPDCGLKTREWSEVIPALKNMVSAAKQIRLEY